MVSFVQYTLFYYPNSFGWAGRGVQGAGCSTGAGLTDKTLLPARGYKSASPGPGHALAEEAPVYTDGSSYQGNNGNGRKISDYGVDAGLSIFSTFGRSDPKYPGCSGLFRFSLMSSTPHAQSAIFLTRPRRTTSKPYLTSHRLECQSHVRTSFPSLLCRTLGNPMLIGLAMAICWKTPGAGWPQHHTTTEACDSV